MWTNNASHGQRETTTIKKQYRVNFDVFHISKHGTPWIGYILRENIFRIYEI